MTKDIENLIKQYSLKHLYRKSNGKSYYQHQRVVSDIANKHNTVVTTSDIKQVLTKKVKGELEQLHLAGMPYAPKDTTPKAKDGEIIEGSVDVKSKTVHDRNKVDLDVYVWLSPEVEKDEEYILDVLGYDKDEWTISKLKLSQWATGVNDEEKTLHNYAIQAQVKKRTADDLKAVDIERMFEDMDFYKFKPSKEPKPMVSDKPHALVWHITDVHFGSEYSNGRHLVEVAHKVIEKYKKDKFTSIIVELTGDILHIDNTQETTNKGTQLKAEGTLYDAYRLSIEVLSGVFAVLRENCDDVDVYWVQGNHSRGMEWAMMNRIAYTFEGDGMTFNVDETLRKAYRYGSTLVGVEHGDAPEKTKFLWLQYEFSDLWGGAKHFEIHGGHTHKDKAVLSTEGGTIYRTARAIKFTDEYEYSHRYQSVFPMTTCYDLDYEQGVVGTFYI